MAKDYIPNTDGEFNTWQANFLTYATANTVALGLVVGDLAAANTAQGDWELAYAAHNEAQVNAAVASQMKKDKRVALVASLRALARRVQASPAVNNNERRALGITVKGDTVVPTGAAATRPLGTIDTGQRLRHEIRFVDEATPTRRARPAGVRGCEVWVKVGAAPTDPGELRFVSLATASPCLAEYSGADAGKVAYYMLRWVTSQDRKGPWSETLSATITG